MRRAGIPRGIPRIDGEQAGPAQQETFMTHGRLITLAALIALAISACSKNSQPTAPAVSASPDTASTSPAAMVRADRSPRPATEPGRVHTDYRTYRQGHPAIILVNTCA